MIITTIIVAATVEKIIKNNKFIVIIVIAGKGIETSLEKQDNAKNVSDKLLSNAE